MTSLEQGAALKTQAPGIERLPRRSEPAAGKADAWDELNHLDETYLEFSTASDIPRGVMLAFGLVPFSVGLFLIADGVAELARTDDVFIVLLMLALAIVTVAAGIFAMRFDLQLPRDRPIRFNRRQRKVYASRYTWNHNPFGRWFGGVDVYDWDTLDAEIVKQTGVSGEVVTQRYSLQLVSRDAQSGDERGRIILQRGGMTTKQFEEQWELIRLYMEHGLDALPPQPLREQHPSFIDCLLVALPWLSPTQEGLRTRARMGVGAWIVAALMSLLFPLWLVCGVGNFVAMRLSPQAVWPADLDAQSRR